MKLKQNENGETVIVSTTTEETKLSADVLISRIALLADEINSLQITLQAVLEFESNTNLEQDMVISDTIDNPIIDMAKLEIVTCSNQLIEAVAFEKVEAIISDNNVEEIVECQPTKQ